MTLFFLLHPPTVSWLPGPIALADASEKKRKKWKEEELMREQKRIKELKEIEHIIVLLHAIEGD